MIDYTSVSLFLLIKPSDNMPCMGSLIVQNFPKQKTDACTPLKYLKSLNYCSGKGKMWVILNKQFCQLPIWQWPGSLSSEQGA